MKKIAAILAIPVAGLLYFGGSKAIQSVKNENYKNQIEYCEGFLAHQMSFDEFSATVKSVESEGDTSLKAQAKAWKGKLLGFIK